MTIPKRMVEGTQLTAGAVTYYTAPAGAKAQIKKFTLTNTTTTAATATIYLVPMGGAANAASTITLNRTVPGSAPGSPGTLDLYELEGHVLETGDFLQALASVAAAVTLMVSGIEITN